jgi:hypothetical protein
MAFPSLNRLNELFEYKNGNLYNKIDRNSKSKKDDIAGSYSGRYGLITIDSQAHTLHKIIFFMHHKYLPEAIDHINGNKHDNRIENLREADFSKNQYNRALNNNNKSGVKNVYWCKTRNRWVAGVRFQGKKIGLGVFDKLEDAAEIVKNFREKNHGDFVNHGTFREVA